MLRTKIITDYENNSMELGMKPDKTKFLNGIAELLTRDFIDPYMELVRLLRDSSEIGHLLLVQYLHTSYSIKPKFHSLVGMESFKSNTLMRVANDQLLHLNYVNKFLVKLKVIPNLQKNSFPFESDIFPFRFTLEKLSQRSLAKYAYIHSPSGYFHSSQFLDSKHHDFVNQLISVLGGNFEVNFLGSIYSYIVEIAEELENSGQLSFSIRSNIKEMKEIQNVGENNHFEFFKNIFMGTHPSFSSISNIWKLPISDSNYPSYNINSDISALKGHRFQIKDEQLRSMAFLSNIHYWVVLKLLFQSYFDESNFSKFFRMSEEHIIGPMHVLGVELAKKGYGTPFDSLDLGYSSDSGAVGYADIISLLIEGRTISHSLQNLPATFNLGIYDQCINKLKQLSKPL